MSRSSPSKADEIPDEQFLQNVLGFDGFRLQFEKGFEIVIEIEQCARSVARPHGFAYSLVLVGPDAFGQRVRLLGFDNAHAAGKRKLAVAFDHEHRENRTRFGLLLEAGPPALRLLTSMQEAIADFLAKAYDLLRREGIDVEAGRVATEPTSAAIGNKRSRVDSKMKQLGSRNTTMKRGNLK